MSTTAKTALIKTRGLKALRKANERTLHMAVTEVNDFGLVPSGLAQQYLDGVTQYLSASASVIEDLDALMVAHVGNPPDPEVDAVMEALSEARDSLADVRVEAESHYSTFLTAMSEFGLSPAEALAVVLNDNPDFFSDNPRKGL